jgi:molecular chaperone DnaJ
MAPRDYYSILGVSPKTTLDEVRRRFRALARQHHPDRNPDDPQAAARFRLVAEAYEAIKSSRARPRRTSANLRQPKFNGGEDIFAEFFGISSDEPLSGSSGPDFRYDLEISLAAALTGLVTMIQVDHRISCRHCQGSGLAPGQDYQQCPTCQGRGRRFGGPGLLRFGPVCSRCHGRGKVITQPCRHCRGDGHRLEKRKYSVHIAPGTEDGARLRFHGEGGEGFRNGPAGDLEVVIRVAPDEFFKRVGNDLHCQIKVSFALAALGGMIRIPTLAGYRDFKLPRGTQSGWTFRFPGAGAPAGPEGFAGDQVNQLVVTIPRDLTSRQREILEKWAHLEQRPWDRAGHE